MLVAQTCPGCPTCPGCGRNRLASVAKRKLVCGKGAADSETTSAPAEPTESAGHGKRHFHPDRERSGLPTDRRADLWEITH